MKILKTTIGWGLIIGSIFFSFLIFKEHTTSIPQPVTSSGSKTESVSSQSLKLTENSTKEIAKTIAEEIIKKNPSGPTGTDGASGISTLNPEELANKVLAQQIENIDLTDFEPQVNFSAIKISPLSDKSALENYLKNFQTILKNNFSGLAVDFKNPALEDFQKLSASYEKTVAQFYTLIVPQKLAAVHAEQIRLMSIQEAIFANLAQYEIDPMKALVAIQLSKEVDSGLNNLKTQVTAFITQNGLKI